MLDLQAHTKKKTTENTHTHTHTRYDQKCDDKILKLKLVYDPKA